MADQQELDAPPARPADHDRSTAPPPRRRKFPWGRVLAGLILLAVIAGAAYYVYATRNEQDTDDAYTDGNAVSVAAQVSGYVVHLAVGDNQFVHKGDLIVKIDPRLFVAARDEARGQLDFARAQLRNFTIAKQIAETTFPARLEAAEANLAAAKAVQFKADADFRRFHAVNPAATTRQDIDNATASARQAAASVLQADAQLKEATLVKPNVDLATQQVNQWQAQVEQAQANLDQATLNLGYTDVVAPQDGWVTKRNVVEGNYLQSGTEIMALVVPDVWVTANFKETELARMRAGQRVRIHVDAYPSLKLTGHVDSVQMGSGSKFTAFPPENATGNFVKIVQRVPVKIVIDSGLDPKLPLPLGISVEPTVDLSSTP